MSPAIQGHWRVRAQLGESQSLSTDLGCHLHMSFDILLHHTTRYLNRRRSRRQEKKAGIEIEVSVCHSRCEFTKSAGSLSCHSHWLKAFTFDTKGSPVGD